MRRFIPSFYGTYALLSILLLVSGAPVFTIGVLGAGMTVAALAPEYR